MLSVPGSTSLCSVIAWVMTPDGSFATAGFTRPGWFTLHLMLTQRPIAVASSLQTTCTDWLISQWRALVFHPHSCRHTCIWCINSFECLLFYTFSDNYLSPNRLKNVAHSSNLQSLCRPIMSPHKEFYQTYFAQLVFRRTVWTSAVTRLLWLPSLGAVIKGLVIRTEWNGRQSAQLCKQQSLQCLIRPQLTPKSK